MYQNSHKGYQITLYATVGTHWRRWSWRYWYPWLLKTLKISTNTLTWFSVPLEASTAGSAQVIYVPSMVFLSGLMLPHSGLVEIFGPVSRTVEHKVSHSSLIWRLPLYGLLWQSLGMTAKGIVATFGINGKMPAWQYSWPRWVLGFHISGSIPDHTQTLDELHWFQ